MTPEPVFDDDLFDAEILVERFGRSEFTIADLCEFFGHSNPWVYSQISKGALEPAKFPSQYATELDGSGRNGVTPARWTKDQVVRAMLRGLWPKRAAVA